MISNSKDRIHSSHFGHLMSSCHTLTALHVVMHLPDESSTNRRHPSSHFLFHNILHVASTLHTLNLTSCIPAYSETAIPGDFFNKMRALRAFRCDNDVFLPKLNNTSIKALDYLSVGEWTLEEAMDGCDGWPSMAVGELSVGDILSVPVSISYPENQQHLRRLNLDIAHSLPTPRSDSTDDQVQAAHNHNLPGGSGIDIDGQNSEVLMEEEGEGQQEGDGADQEVDNASSVISISSENLQTGALDVLPPTITYLSLLIRRWEHLSRHIFIHRLPASITTLGLEAGEEHSTDTSYRHLVNTCRDIIAPGLTVVQLNHWQTCVDLRTRHPGILKEFVEMLGNRNVELWDSEGFVMEGTVS
ncbi:hypothetical protein ONZ45_g10469 [Pleurotus djamor]|nr:hypothetical protein ONZ45_g10469 [Pleurotus djamor]